MYIKVGFLGLLTILFIALRLTDNIDWSWWWVLSPLWIPWAIVIGGAAVAFFIAGIVFLVQAIAIGLRRIGTRKLKVPRDL